MRAILFLLVPFFVYAQEDTTRHVSVGEQHRRFLASLGTGQTIYYGKDYHESPKTDFDQHAYYEDDDWQMGNIRYCGDEYPDVPLKYNLFEDKLLTEYHNGAPINPVFDLVESFTLSGRLFVPIKTADRGLQKGYYEQVYNGPSRVLARWEKKYSEELDRKRKRVEYTIVIRYYINTPKGFQQVSNKGSVLRAFPQYKKQIRSFYKSLRPNFTLNRSMSLAQTAAFIDTLSTAPQP